MTGRGSNRSLERRVAGMPDQSDAEYAARRTDLEERLAAAPTRGLANAYLAAIEELDAAWARATGGAPLGESLGSRESPVEPATSASLGEGPGTNGRLIVASEGEVESLDHGAVSQVDAQFTPDTDPNFDTRSSTPETRQASPYTPKRLAVFGGVAVVALLALAATCYVLVALEDPAPIPGSDLPLTVAIPDAIPTKTPDPLLEPVKEPLPPAIGTSDLTAARRLAEEARAVFGRAEKPDGVEFPDAAQADRLMTEAAEAMPAEIPASSAMLYRRAAQLFTDASARSATVLAGRAEAAALAWADRWNTVQPEVREPWRARLDEASVRLDTGTRLLADGRVEDGRKEFEASAAAFDSLWAEYMTGLVRSARLRVTPALTEWDSLFGPLAQAGLAEPAEVKKARAQVQPAAPEELPAVDELKALGQAESVLVGATARLRQDLSVLEGSRLEAERSRSAFDSAEKTEKDNFPGADRGAALMERGASALGTEGPVKAAELYRLAAGEFAGASMLAAERVAERVEADRREVLSDIQALRTAIGTVADARATAVDRVAKASSLVERLQKQGASTDPAGTDSVVAQLSAATADLEHASRVLAVDNSIGLSDSSLSSLRRVAQSSQESIEKGGKAPVAALRESLATARTLGTIAGLVDGAVRSESQARVSADRWKQVAAAERRQWEQRLDQAATQFEAGSRMLGEGRVADGTKELDSAGASFNLLWAEFMTDSVNVARGKVSHALAEWEALYAPLGQAGLAEPSEVKESRSSVDAGATRGMEPEKELAVLRRAETLLVGATSRLREERAAIAVSGADGLTPLHRAAMDGKLSVVEAILEQGADVNARSGDGQTALVLAVRSGHAEIVQKLLDAGADRNTGTPEGCPLAFLAAASPDTLRIFLDEAGKIRYRGRTILHEIAASGMERKIVGSDQARMAEMVLQKFPGLIGDKDSLGLTALDLARQRNAKELVFFLTQWGPKK